MVRSSRPVPLPLALGLIAATAAVLAVLAMSPLRAVFSSEEAWMVVRGLSLVGLAVAAVADVRGWSRYTRRQRQFAFLVWTVLGALAVSSFVAG